MTWSDQVRVGLVHIFVCNFQVRLDFFSFMSNISAVPDPSLGRVGSGRVFFGRVGSGLSGRVARDRV